MTRRRGRHDRRQRTDWRARYFSGANAPKRRPYSSQVALTTVMLWSRNPSLMPRSNSSRSASARTGNDPLGQHVYLHKGIGNQAIRFRNIPSVIRWVVAFFISCGGR
jgi:hypothetical protein